MEHIILIAAIIFFVWEIGMSLSSLVNMERINTIYDRAEGKPITAVLHKTEYTKPWKKGIFGFWTGTYRLETETGTKEYKSVNIFPAEAAVPKEITVYLNDQGVVLERWQAEQHFARRILPTWVVCGVFIAFVYFILCH